MITFNHILGNAALGSPYKVMAAASCNAHGDTLVSTIDLLYTRQLILGSSSSYPTGRLWQFVSSGGSRTYTNLSTNQTNQDFIGIKLGDVNDSWDPNIQ